MFEDFVKILCEKEYLIDIGKYGVASQSSFSKWSKENDAQRALNNVDVVDYAFHTEKEHNPWWRVDFDKSYAIRHIVINNRQKKPYDAISSTIEVYGILKSGEKLLLHKGNLNFGSLPYSVPLIITRYNCSELKSIIVSLPSENYLHLCCINILAEANSLNRVENKLVFYSNRTDGLGERLRALLNIITVSNATDGSFYFSWQERKGASNLFHSTTTKENIFSNEYIERNILTTQKIDSLKLLPLENMVNISSSEVDDYVGIAVKQNSLENQINDEKFPVHLLDYRKAYESIAFSDHMLEARALAEKLSLDNKTISIHVRAGDIVYGVHRFTNRFFSKVIPAYIFDCLISTYKEAGYKIVLFGQDELFCNGLCNDYDIVYSNECYKSDFDESQKAFFDISLMSQSEIIVSGSSGFSIFSSLISEASLKYFTSILTKDQIRNAFNEAMMEDGILNKNYVSPLMKSFSILHFLFNQGSYLTPKYKLKLINTCILLDSQNSFIKVVKSIYMFEEQNVLMAETILLEILESKSKFNMQWLIEKDKLIHVIKIIRKYSKEGSAIAATVLLLYELHNSKNINIDFYLQVLANQSVNTLGYDMLKNHLDKIVAH